HYAVITLECSDSRIRIIEIVRRTDSRLVVVPLMDKNYAEDLLKFHRLCNWITVISETCVKTM
ncbi:unnamed protein product, partial [Heterotrigona itama]